MNNGIITTKRNLTPEKVRAVMEDINKRYFDGKLVIFLADDAPWLGVFQERERTDGVPLVSVRLTSRRRAETRKGGGGDFMGWIETVFQEEIAAAFNGRCASEGGEERWDPRPGKFPTFRAYYDHLHSWGKPLPKDYAEYLFNATIERIPEDLRPFIG